MGVSQCSRIGIVHFVENCRKNSS